MKKLFRNAAVTLCACLALSPIASFAQDPYLKTGNGRVVEVDPKTNKEIAGIAIECEEGGIKNFSYVHYNQNGTQTGYALEKIGIDKETGKVVFGLSIILPNSATDPWISSIATFGQDGFMPKLVCNSDYITKLQTLDKNKFQIVKNYFDSLYIQAASYIGKNAERALTLPRSEVKKYINKLSSQP